MCVIIDIGLYGAAEPLISFRGDDDEMRLRLVDDYIYALVVSDLASRAEQRTAAVGRSLAR